MNSNKYKTMNTNKVVFNLVNSIPKKRSTISTGNLYGSDYSTITNSNIYSNKKAVRPPTDVSPEKSFLFNTIDDCSRNAFNLSRISIEHDILLSSLKKKLAMIKDERKKSEICVTNKKKKIYELQKEEQKSLKQLENTKKYIKKIIDNRKKRCSNRKNFDIKITKINNIFHTSKSPNNKILNTNDISNFNNTWFAPRKKKLIIKKNHLTNKTCHSGLDSININYNSNKNNRLTIDLNEINNSKSITHNNSSNYHNTECRKVYNRKKIMMNNNIKNNNKSNKNNKTLKENLIQKLKKDEEEKLKIQKQIEEIEKEQNNLYNNFYENFCVNYSYKTLEYNDN